MRKAFIIAAVVGLATFGSTNNSSAQLSPGFFPVFTGGSGISPLFGRPVTNIPRTGALLGITPIDGPPGTISNRRNLLNRADNAFFGAFGISRVSNLFGF